MIEEPNLTSKEVRQYVGTSRAILICFGVLVLMGVVGLGGYGEGQRQNSKDILELKREQREMAELKAIAKSIALYSTDIEQIIIEDMIESGAVRENHEIRIKRLEALRAARKAAIKP